MTTMTSPYTLQTEGLFAFASALMFHGVVFTGVWFGIQITPINLMVDQGFEMIDLAPRSNQQMHKPQTVVASQRIIPKLPPESARDVEADKLVPADVPVPETKPRKVAVVKPVAKKMVSTPSAVIHRQPIEKAPDVINDNTHYTAPISHAAYLHNPKPRYPRAARQRGMQGLVKLTVMVDVDGQPVSVDLNQSSGFSVLDREAIKAVRQWRFAPARRGNTNVAGEVMVPIHFKLDKV